MKLVLLIVSFDVAQPDARSPLQPHDLACVCVSGLTGFPRSSRC